MGQNMIKTQSFELLMLWQSHSYLTCIRQIRWAFETLLTILFVKFFFHTAQELFLFLNTEMHFSLAVCDFKFWYHRCVTTLSYSNHLIYLWMNQCFLALKNCFPELQKTALKSSVLNSSDSEKFSAEQIWNSADQRWYFSTNLKESSLALICSGTKTVYAWRNGFKIFSLTWLLFKFVNIYYRLLYWLANAIVQNLPFVQTILAVVL